MNFKTGDKVIVIAGKDKGKSGKITKILKSTNMVIVEGLNMVRKHLKPNANNESGGIIDMEAPIHASNVMIMDAKTNKPTRISKTIDKKNNKIRICKKSNEKID